MTEVLKLMSELVFINMTVCYLERRVRIVQEERKSSGKIQEQMHKSMWARTSQAISAWRTEFMRRVTSVRNRQVPGYGGPYMPIRNGEPFKNFKSG